MTTRMLIDARHPEETRVAVLKGNRIEEFDFESAEHKQIKGNIYLAKVTRVEPSLQAAFVDFGGNRHGFLAFSEIHPDYYQIPKEDREALLAEEAAHAEEEAALRAVAEGEEDFVGDDELGEGLADDYAGTTHQDFNHDDSFGGVTEIDTFEKDEVATIEAGHIEDGFDHDSEEAAGEGGETLVRDMLRDAEYVPVGFVDDRRALARRRIHGVPVLGVVENLPALVERYRVDLVVIAIPSANNLEMQSIVEVCERAGCTFRTLPRLQDVVSGKLGLREIRQVAIDDLLGRSAVELDWPTIQTNLAGKTVLVTGGGGSIGAELCRQVARLGASRLIVLEQNEHGLYMLERELRAAHPHLKFGFVLGDVCDKAAVECLFARELPQIVFHAAAYKHVPIVEQQVREGVKNNVLGTRVIANAAARHQVESVVLISTDKAVRPSSVMGATKRVAELVCEAANQRSRTRFITVRFGNVLGSAGSVVPLFQEQIRSGGPVTVTHPEASRYFMTIPEASQLILQAAALGKGGEIFVLEMGLPVNIGYLAEQMIRLSGHEPGQDIRIVYTGLRPGEKLREELFHGDEELVPTTHQKVLLAVHSPVDVTRVDEILATLEGACERFDSNEQIAQLLRAAVPGFVTPSDPAASAASTVLAFRRGSP